MAFFQFEGLLYGHSFSLKENEWVQFGHSGNFGYVRQGIENDSGKKVAIKELL